ncbi:MAG TPA: hypothetical protein VHD90_04005 [Phototrophicaceae bacterium]|nr:hypothetical protein [Phototrophicaceae bacterium]
MKLLRRLIFVVALLVALAAIVLLLNFTAPNPTGRRYSSEPVQITGNAQVIGASGEVILAYDLRLPDNDNSDQRQCFCNDVTKPPSSKCNTCLVSDSSIATYRIPDFVSPNFIAEAKNRQNLLFSYSDQVDQISDYVTAALLLKRPLWLYTRVDTVMSPEFDALVASTGGGVVPYFATPGYVDPVDQIARPGLIAALIVLVLSAIWEIGAGLVSAPRQPQAPKPAQPADPHTKAARKAAAAEDFLKAARDHHQRKIDTEDSRDQP